MAEPLSMFISYAPTNEDEALLIKFEKHLSLLKKQGLITLWHRRKTVAGVNWQQALDAYLESASIILLLISADFLASDDCNREAQRAFAHHEAGTAIVIPILLHPADLGGTPFEHFLYLPRNKRPIALWKSKDEAFTTIVSEIRATIEKRTSQQNKQPGEKERKIQALFTDHAGFLRDRLESFVGRLDEQAHVREMIDQRLRTGGYVTITGQAGQGKSSIIAKLVESYGIDQVAHHFIPLNPGPDHQVGLLRNLMARLILKYDLSDLYVTSDNRAALREYFPKVLMEVVARKGQEVVFVDGLDQLEEDFNGVRDLSFLPINPPPGIVFVLGTRPNDTMKPLELLKPRDEYRLPNFSRQDFNLILRHRRVSVELAIADQFYEAMSENALYLDLAAKELMAWPAIDHLAIIKRITANPDNIFSLSIERLKRQAVLWEKVIYPILGVLLAAQEPMTSQCIGDILKVADYKLKDGIARLGGLITEDAQQRFSLFHLKFRDYLSQDEEHPWKEYVFSIKEEKIWHRTLIAWCESEPLDVIWKDVKDPVEQARRIYVRHHYVTHLYQAHQWQPLFVLLNEGTYGREKVRYDPSTRAYAQDLDFGRQAAAWNGRSLKEGLGLLPDLWRYTLLRCSLRSRANQYPLEAFQLLLSLGRETEAIGLTELLTVPFSKVQVLLIIAGHLASLPERQQDSIQIFFRAYEIARSMDRGELQAAALRELALALAKAGYQGQAEDIWHDAEAAARSIKWSYQQATILRELTGTLVEAKRWEQAEAVARSIEQDEQQAVALSVLAHGLVRAEGWERAERIWLDAMMATQPMRQREPLYVALRNLAGALIEAKHWEQAEEIIRTLNWNEWQIEALREMAKALIKAGFRDQAERVLHDTEEGIRSLKQRELQITALRDLARTLTEIKRWEWAEKIWLEAETVARSGEWSDQQITALKKLTHTLIEVEYWDQAEIVARSIDQSGPQIEVLRELVKMLAQVKRWEQATAIAQSIERREWRVLVLRELARYLIEAQHWEQAETVARSIDQSELQIEILKELTQALMLVERWEQAETVARSIDQSEQRAIVLRELTQALIEAQRWEQALSIVYSIKWNDWQAAILKVLAQSLTKAKHWELAEKIWFEAEAGARAIIWSNQQAEALRELARALMEVHRWEQALSVVYAIKWNDWQAASLRELALILMEGQHWEQAEKVWVDAEAVARSIEQSEMRIGALKELTRALIEVERWQQAEAVARSIEQSGWRVEMLRELAQALMETHHWELAEAIARSIEWIDWRAEALRKLVGSLNKAKRWSQAEAVARSIENSDWQAEALGELARTLIGVKRWKQAQKVWLDAEVLVHSSNRDNWQAKALSTFAGELAKARCWEQTEEVIGTIEQSELQIGALKELTHALIRSERWQQAEIVARSISHSEQQAMILGELAQALLETRHWSQAEAVAHSIEHNEQQSAILRELALALIEAEHWKQAEMVVRSIKRSDWQTEMLKELARALIGAEHWEQAEAVACSIQWSNWRAEVLSELAGVLANANRWSQAERIWRDIEALPRSIRQSRQHVEALRELSEAFIVAEYWEQAEAVACSIQWSDWRAAALKDLVRALIERKCWSKAEKVAYSIENENQRFMALKDLAAALFISNEYEEAIGLIQRSWLLVETRDNALQVFPLAFGLISLRPQIGSAFHEALTWVNSFFSR